MTRERASQRNVWPVDDPPDDWEAFESILKAYQTPLYHLLVMLVGNRQEARALAVEVFRCIHNSLDSYDPSTTLSLTTWFYRIAATCCLRALQRKRWAWWPANRSRQMDNWYDSESKEPARLVLLHLPIQERLALVLHEALGLSCLEVAEVLDLSQRETQALFATARNHFCAVSLHGDSNIRSAVVSLEEEE